MGGLFEVQDKEKTIDTQGRNKSLSGRGYLPLKLLQKWGVATALEPVFSLVTSILKIAFSPCDIVDAFPYIAVYTYIFHVEHLLISDGNSLHRILDIINFADSFFTSIDESSFYGSRCSMMR